MSDAAGKIATRLAELWKTSRPVILERMATLQTAHAALTRNPADAEAQSTGREAAHKLSGVLGVFGLPQGSQLASGIETVLESPQALTADDVSGLASRIRELEAVIASKAAS